MPHSADALPCAPCIVRSGTLDDYRGLAHLHYRGGPPATVAREPGGGPSILAARDGGGRLAGVLVVSMPTLNGAWRSLAWPGLFDTGDKRRDALAINNTLRCISRVIVDPRFRGQGVARALVRASLERASTPCTEAVAAMGHLCPFFASAGMTAYPLAPSARDARLADALASVGVEPWEVLEPRAATRTLARHPWLAREARTWANHSQSTRRHMRADPVALLQLAASHAAQPPVAYAHTR
ncbi:MAG: GNAT family N-acetyltransferase [Phycisphaerales bacterium JB041]